FLVLIYAWNFKKNNWTVSAFPCGEPQPRVFYLEDLVDRDEWKLKYEPVLDNIKPQSTILYRCEFTGCCEDRETRCLPAKIEEVGVTFRNVTERVLYFQIQVKNHTTCACLSIDTSGKKNIK
ncbi:hypothetical protein NQ315_004244, partial [Exocentrus adspersus]